jgi:hypothetical protein
MTATLEDRPTEAKRARIWPWAVVAVALLMVVGVLGARWYSGLSLLGPFGSSESVPAPLGHTLYADTGLSGASTTASSLSLHVTAITPHVDSNTSNATIHLMVCLRNRNPIAIGAQETGLSDSCSSVRPLVAPMTITLGFTTIQVLVAVTPYKPGTVHIEGIDVTYTQGLRHTTQQGGLDLTFTTP